MKSQSRKTSIILSSATGIVFGVVTILLNFALRTVLVSRVGIEYVGLYAFFSEVIGLLMSVDGGLCSGLFIKIHKPIANNDRAELRKVFRVIQIVYRIRAFMVFIVGIILLFLLPTLIGETGIAQSYINGIYCTYLIINAASFLLVYYQFIIEAYQKRFVTNLVTFIVSVVAIGLNIVCLYIMESFTIYVILVTSIRLVSSLICYFFVKKNYPDLFTRKSDKKLTFAQIKDEIKDMFKITYYIIANVIVKNTDSILVTNICGLSVNGVFSNYKMLGTQIFNLIDKVKFSIQDSSRAFLVKAKPSESIDLIRNTTFLYFWIAGFSFVSLSALSTPFISLWIGSENTISDIPIVLMTMTLFLETLIAPMDDVFYCTESYTLHKLIPVIEVLINLLISIILGMHWGIAGIMIGTLAYFVFKILVRSNVLYRESFKASNKEYIGSILGYCCVTLVAYSLVVAASLPFGKITILNFVIKMGFCVIIPNGLFWLVYHKNKSFQYFLLFVKRCVTKTC